MSLFAILKDRAVIAVSGPDARLFLQGLITNDMEMCRDGQAIYAGLLTPQGKILFEFFVIESGADRFLLDCAAARAGDLAKRLRMYVLRAKVEISPTDLAVGALWAEVESSDLPANSANAVVFADPRLPVLGLRVLGTAAEIPSIAASSAPGNYNHFRIDAGVPDSADLPPDTVFALDAGFEELNGVSFRKGCYIGQEVTSRMKHRATARRRFLIAQADPPPSPGTPIEAGGLEIGTFATGENGQALAMVRLDRWADAADRPIRAAGHSVTLKKPHWLAV